jgi:3-methyladenine DNA glycosylase AlkD
LDTPLLRRIRAAFVRARDPSKADGMRAYMKSAMPYHGVSAPVMRRTCREVFATHAVVDAETWRADVLATWRGARFREERYAAIELTGDRRARPFQTLDALAMYEELIVTGAWWDYVDSLASHRIGALLPAYPKPMRRTLRAWSRDADMWKRRTSILVQLGFKDTTDLDLLYACIAPSLSSREFFLQKAIGWALRQYAWTDPVEVERYVREQGASLAPLSRREAMKNILRSK